MIEERLELYRVFIEAGALPGYDRKDAAMDENATSWKDVIVDSEQNEEAVMQAREGDAEQIEIAEEKVTEAPGSRGRIKAAPEEFQQQRRRV